MANEKGIFISAKQLTKGAVRRFYDAHEQRTAGTESLPNDDERFEGDGIAFLMGEHVLGLYLYRGLAGLRADTTLYYPSGGMLSEYRNTRHHQALIESLIQAIKTDSKVQIIVKLDKQPIHQGDEIVEDEAFWLKQGFSPLDKLIYYQGTIKYTEELKCNDFQYQSDFSVNEYAGGDEATNAELCFLYREAYKRQAVIPDVTSEGINRQLSIPSCSYLIMRHKDELIGQATLFISNNDCYVDSLHIKRSYWGKGASDQLGWSMLHYAKNRGCQTVSGMVAYKNRPSSALLERFWSTAQYQVKRLTLSL
jgi:hypothetical protein